MQCFRNFPVVKKVTDKGGNIPVVKKVTDKGGDQDFPSKNFSLTKPKKIAGESFTVSLFSGIEKC